MDANVEEHLSEAENTLQQLHQRRMELIDVRERLERVADKVLGQRPKNDDSTQDKLGCGDGFLSGVSHATYEIEQEINDLSHAVSRLESVFI